MIRIVAILILCLAVLMPIRTFVLKRRGGLSETVVRPVAVRVGLAIGRVLLIFVAVLVVFENKFIFVPTRGAAGGWDRPDLKVERCYITTSDGLRLHAWWHPGTGETPADERPVLLWFHGNAGNISHRDDNLTMLTKRGLAVLIIDYRGYGLSEGRPSEVGFYRDGEAAWRFLTEERGIAPERIVCFGRSLGGAVALDVALKHKVAGLVLESVFISVPAMARRNLITLPVAPLARNKFNTLRRIPDLKVPLLLIHGRRDRIVPIEHGMAVFEAAPDEDKALHVVESAGHNDLPFVADPPYWQALTEFCTRCITSE